MLILQKCCEKRVISDAVSSIHTDNGVSERCITPYILYMGLDSPETTKRCCKENL